MLNTYKLRQNRHIIQKYKSNCQEKELKELKITVPGENWGSIWLCQPFWPVFAIYPVFSCHSFSKAFQRALIPITSCLPSTAAVAAALPGYDVSLLSLPHNPSLLHCPGWVSPLLTRANRASSCHLPSDWPHSTASPGPITFSLKTLQRSPMASSPSAKGALAVRGPMVLPASLGSSPAGSAWPHTHMVRAQAAALLRMPFLVYPDPTLNG